MNMSINNIDYYIDVKKEVKLIFAVCLGLFLVILFLRPFELQNLNPNNQILFFAGFGVIAFILLFVFQVIVPKTSPKLFQKSIWEFDSADLAGIINWIICTVAFTFYLKYVGKAEITFHVVFKLLILSIAPIGFLKVIYNNRRLQARLEILQERLKGSQHETKNVHNYDDVFINLYSESRTDLLKLTLSELIVIKSADNYIEVVYKQDETVQKALLRNTLKSIENELKAYEEIVRCHRTFIINVLHVNQIVRNNGGYKIQLKNYDEVIPLSRQYLLNVRQSLDIA